MKYRVYMTISLKHSYKTETYSYTSFLNVSMYNSVVNTEEVWIEWEKMIFTKTIPESSFEKSSSSAASGRPAGFNYYVIT